MLKKILIAFATVVGLVLAIGLVLPSKYRVERSTVLQAPPEALYRHVASLQRWQEWAPWNVKRYPGSQWTFGGPAEGVGAVRSWSGEDVGQGTLSLTEADPKTGVAYEVSVAQGRYLARGRISFAPEGSGTRVTWVDEGGIGGNPLAHYWVPLLRSRLGADMEAGLARLAKVAHEHSLPGAPTPEPEPTPASVEQASAEPPPPASEQAAPAAEGSPQAAPTTEGTQVAAPAPSSEGSQGAAPVETPPATAATTPPTGESAPAPQGTAAPSGEQSAPAQTPPSGETAPATTNAASTPSPP
jgi:polyketide cyclase/dehydrase/lipid transport protein